MAEPAEMELAAKDASNELDILLATETAPATELLKWYQRWYTKAGHKRLGRLLVKVGKEIA
jgi:hypothetical protein